MPGPTADRAHAPSRTDNFTFAAALACMGVVFGDIGTSPLYARKEAVRAASAGGTLAPAAVLGILSLIFWSLILVISIKYALLIMRADSHGEGGILALLACSARGGRARADNAPPSSSSVSSARRCSTAMA